MKTTKFVLLLALLCSMRVVLANGTKDVSSSNKTAASSQQIEQDQNNTNENRRNGSTLKGILSGAVAVTCGINAALRTWQFGQMLRANIQADKMSDRIFENSWIYVSNILLNAFICVKAIECAQKSLK